MLVLCGVWWRHVFRHCAASATDSCARKRSGATESVESAQPFVSTAQSQRDSISGYLLLECGLLLLRFLLVMCARGPALARGSGGGAFRW